MPIGKSLGYALRISLLCPHELLGVETLTLPAQQPEPSTWPLGTQNNVESRKKRESGGWGEQNKAKTKEGDFFLPSTKEFDVRSP